MLHQWTPGYISTATSQLQSELYFIKSYADMFVNLLYK